MSGIFGIFNRNGKPVDEKIVESMLESMSSWNPDERNLWVEGSIALGHAMLWNTPESKYEHLPLEKKAYILTMDARIDNREELLNELELPDSPLSEIGDSEFILAAYRKWGEECPKHLLGDFSFSIWDNEKKLLFCVRDHIGIKPFFYFQSEEFFVFSNDISVLLKHPYIPHDLDDLTVAYFIKDEVVYYSQHATFFEKIKKLPPATSMIVSEKKIYENCYWHIEDSPQIRYKTFDEYTKKLRELFNNAVEARIRTDYTVASHLSGGTDSSPIAVQAARNLKDSGRVVHVFNYIDIPDDKDLYEYEAWNFSRRIARQEENIIHEEFYMDPVYRAKQYLTHNIFTQGTMYYWDEYYIQERMKKIDARVMLSGWGGDELISNNGYSFISNLWMQGKILSALYYIFREKMYSQYLGFRLIKSILKAMLPSKLFVPLRKIVKSDSDVWEKCDVDKYMYVKDTFVKFTESQPDVKFPTIKGVRNRQLALYNLGHLQSRTESWFLSGISNRMEYRYPLLDKRIVEFAVGIPEELFYPKKGKERPLFKTAILDLLPLDILWFNKPDETKINISNKKRYIAALEVLRENLYHQKPKLLGDKYFNYDKLLRNILGFKKENICKVGKIAVALLFLEAKIKLKELGNYHEKSMGKTKDSESSN